MKKAVMISLLSLFVIIYMILTKMVVFYNDVWYNFVEKGDIMSKIEILKEYYKRVCAPLIFVGERYLNDENTAKVYVYDFNNEEELMNFKKVFQEYLPFYVRNFDRIARYKLEGGDAGISRELLIKALGIKKDKILLTNRASNQNGIYGELYNDFYLRNIAKQERLATYLMRREYNREGQESKGIDVVTCALKGGTVEVSLSEAKFVKNLGSAKSELKDDIIKHVNKEYINGFMNFVMQHQGEVICERTTEINEKINQFNDLIEDEGLEFIDALNRMGFSAKFVFFALFNNESREDNTYKAKMIELIDKFYEVVTETGIEKYTIEIVFIPTFNEVQKLKDKMEEWDE